MIKLRRGMFRFLAALPLLGLTAGASFAEGPTVSGYVDTNWSQNTSMPADKTTTLRSYDNPDGNINNNAHVAITGSLGEQAAYVVEIDAGHEAVITSAGAEFDIQEAYLTYVSASKLGIKVGKFATFQGIEVLEGPMNPTITRGYLYGIAECFTHSGGVLTYVAGKLDFAAGVINGMDVPNDNNDSKTFAWKVGYSGGDPLALTLSGYHGAEQSESVFTSSRTNTSGNIRTNIDVTGITKLIPKVDLWFQAHYGQEEMVTRFDEFGVAGTGLGKWSGFGIQPVVKISDKFSVGGRVEYFADPDGAKTATDDFSSTNFTVTPGYMLTDKVGVKAEYRYDMANKKVFDDEDGTLEDTASSIGLQFYAIF